MNLFRPQIPYVFRPPRYSPWFKPVLHSLSYWYLRKQFNIHNLRIRGAERVAELVKSGQSVLVTPNHADHADPPILVQTARRYGFVFHFMAAREGFEKEWIRRFILQKSGAFSVDREGADLSSIKTAIEILQACRYPLVIFPEGEIYHHHETLDELNEGVATILLRAAARLPEGKKSYVVPTAIRITHDNAVADTFSDRLARLEKQITWKPRINDDPVNRIYRLGSALISIKEEEFLGAARQGGLVDRIRELQRQLIEQVEAAHGKRKTDANLPGRIKRLRNLIRKELTNQKEPLPEDRKEELYDELDRIFVAQQLYSYPGQYLKENPTVHRIAETIFKLEEDVLGIEQYPVPRSADVYFGEPVDVLDFLKVKSLTPKTGVMPMTELLRERLGKILESL